MPFQKTKTSGLTSVNWQCKDCDACRKDGAAALAATRHFHETGHSIRVEQSIWWEWKAGALIPVKKKGVKSGKEACTPYRFL